MSEGELQKRARKHFHYELGNHIVTCFYDKKEIVGCDCKEQPILKLIEEAKRESPKNDVGIDIFHPYSFEEFAKLEKQRREWFVKWFGE